MLYESVRLDRQEQDSGERERQDTPPKEEADETPANRARATAALPDDRSEEHTSELQSLMRISYAVFCLKKKKNRQYHTTQNERYTYMILHSSMLLNTHT